MALEWAVHQREQRWTQDLEISATTAELTHALLLTLLRVNGAKQVGKPMHIPRPWDEKKPKLISMGQFARQVKGGFGG